MAIVHFIAVATVFGVLTFRRQQVRLAALLGMTLGLYLLWVAIGGVACWRLGGPVRRWGEQHKPYWIVRFFLASLAMGMTEESVTTLMTNLAPLFRVRVGEVYITASSNYWDVILGHSLIVIAPTFLAWCYLLKRYWFQPAAVFLLFGLTGTFMETIYGGLGQLVQIGMWMLVYGLMVYLPACSVPSTRSGRRPEFRHCLLAVVLPFAFMPLCIPILFLIRAIRPSAALQFPPILLQGR